MPNALRLLSERTSVRRGAPRALQRGSVSKDSPAFARTLRASRRFRAYGNVAKRTGVVPEALAITGRSGP